MSRARLTVLICLLAAGLYPQGLTTETSLSERINREMMSIRNRKITDDLFLRPVRENIPGPDYFNIVGKLSNKVRIEPVLALRYSSAGFELSPDYVPSGVLWVTPGVKVSGTFPIFAPYINLWVYAWGRFDKHTAISTSGEPISTASKLFPYEPELNADFHTKALWPDNAVDFDEGQGGIALMSSKFELAFGKFRTSAGPSPQSNLGISATMPAFAQIHLLYRISPRIRFTYFMGSLYSNIPDLGLYSELYEDSLNSKDKYPVYARYIAHHRLDLYPWDNFRVGFYEQVILGGSGSVLEYVNPVFPYWSAQHSLGDIDNIQMGFDWDWIVRGMRLYGAFYMDEWAPYQTFSARENHNWFALQAGFTQVIDIPDHPLYVNLEYTWCDPRTYIHRFAINNPRHYDYPVGFWAGGNSDDLRFRLQTDLSPLDILRLSLENTRWGEQDVAAIYDDNFHQFLSGPISSRMMIKLEWERQLNHHFILNLSLAEFRTDQLYEKDNFTDLMLSIRYNIPR